MELFETTKQREIFTKRGVKKYYIEDELLSDCIGRGRKSTNEYERVLGFNEGKSFGYALLSYFTSRALNIPRLPFCLDRIYHQFSFAMSTTDRKILNALDEEKVEKICGELKEAYIHTQESLKDAGLKSVFLRRELTYYSATIINLIKCSRLLDLRTIEIEMDTLNSFGDADEYHKEFSLELEIPIENILYCSSLIDSHNCKEVLVEDGEWVVINRSPNGIFQIPTKSIVIRKDCSDRSKITVTDARSAEQFMKDYSPLYIRQFFESRRD